MKKRNSTKVNLSHDRHTTRLMKYKSKLNNHKSLGRKSIKWFLTSISKFSLIINFNQSSRTTSISHPFDIDESSPSNLKCTKTSSHQKSYVINRVISPLLTTYPSRPRTCTSTTTSSSSTSPYKLQVHHIKPQIL